MINDKTISMVIEYLSSISTKYKFKNWEQNVYDCGWSLVAKNHSTGIEIVYENREHNLFIKLYKLKNGQIKPIEGEITPTTEILGYDIFDIIYLKYPEKKDEYFLFDIDRTKYLKIIKKYLETLCDDILKGDFKMFNDLDKVVKQRAREAAFDKWGDKAKNYGW